MRDDSAAEVKIYYEQIASIPPIERTKVANAQRWGARKRFCMVAFPIGLDDAALFERQFSSHVTADNLKVKGGHWTLLDK